MQSPLSLLELNQLIQQSLDANLAPSYWVIAEIGEFRDSPRGHAYLELVEKSNKNILAKIRANIWSYTYRGIASRFNTITGQNLKAGMKILAQVGVQFHEVYGLSVNIKDIDPNFTLGEKARKRQETIDLLNKEGLMDLNKQFLLSKVPQKVAVISSVNAAGYGDFINQVAHNRSQYKVHYKLYQATMQGDQAVDSLILAIKQVEADLIKEKFDLMVIIRGGGAQLDLDCFDDYELAKSIACTSLPVVTGIGHERDESIADMVAHTKMKTPTAVAEFILSGFRNFEDLLETHFKQIERHAAYQLQKEDRKISNLEHLLKSISQNQIQRSKDQTQVLRQRIISQAQHILKLKSSELLHMESAMKKSVSNILSNENFKLNRLDKDLQRLDPNTFLKRGYTRTEIMGTPINNVGIKSGDELTTYTLSEKIKSTVNSIEENEQ
ncbi:exodeoxyribonuclease VII large subunit [Echinicola marina]|uniref:exodeoxyribonuclease VII large subunit n=1 Tax=Echinicola marina TaxID=2859768 RepID=UPI001CF643D0|nr:exodeoxyribonuclease VII large subunit [Echinicola marina]UCS93133.1 exodeoxyribonuclease VII large subunit [Echinicola marina]